MFVRVAIEPDCYVQAENIISLEIDEDEVQVWVKGGESDLEIHRSFKRDSETARWYNNVLRSCVEHNWK